MIRFFFKLFFLGSFLAGLCLIYGFFIEPKRLETRQFDVTPSYWTSGTLRIGVISDIHIGGRHMPPERVMRIVDSLNALNPDIVLIAGDFIDGHHSRQDMSDNFNQQVDDGLKILSKLKAPMGRYAVIGNHDVMYNAGYVETALEHAGVTVLTNQAVMQDDVCIVGLADHETQQEDTASFSVCKAKASLIALMHSPDSFQYMPQGIGLAAAGHTHGGQINIPFLGRLSTITDMGPSYKHGLRRYKGDAVYISAGLGTSILPARFRSPPEIVLLRLRPKSDH